MPGTMGMSAGVTAHMRMPTGMTRTVRMSPHMRALYGMRRLHRGAHSAAPRTPISSSVR